MLRSLSNDDNDGNENGKKVTGLDKQNNNFAPAINAFFVFNVSMLSLLDCEEKFLIPRFMEDVNTRKRFSFSFCELTDNPLEFNSRKIVNI